MNNYEVQAETMVNVLANKVSKLQNELLIAEAVIEQQAKQIELLTNVDEVAEEEAV
jgi:hypothetical protein